MVLGSFKECSDLAKSFDGINFSWKVFSMHVFIFIDQGHSNMWYWNNLFILVDKAMSTIKKYLHFCSFENVGQRVSQFVKKITKVESRCLKSVVDFLAFWVIRACPGFGVLLFEQAMRSLLWHSWDVVSALAYLYNNTSQKFLQQNPKIRCFL